MEAHCTIHSTLCILENSMRKNYVKIRLDFNHIKFLDRESTKPVHHAFCKKVLEHFNISK